MHDLSRMGESLDGGLHALGGHVVDASSLSWRRGWRGLVGAGGMCAARQEAQCSRERKASWTAVTEMHGADCIGGTAFVG